MSFASSILPALNRIRAIPGTLGLRIHSVTLVTGEWSGDHTGDGTETATETPLTHAGGQSPKVHWLNMEELALGSLPKGSVEVGPITPTVGASLSWFGQQLDAGETLHLRITGPEHPTGALYRITHAHQESALSLKLTAEPVREV